MPLPLALAAALPYAVPAVAGLIGTGASAMAQGSMNAKTRDHNYEMWLKQNTLDADNWNKQNAYNEQMWGQQKDYNEGLWNKQNEYNQQMWHQQNKYDSPAMQMARFKEAGLNPNLIYGNMGGGGGIQTAQLEDAKFQSSGGPDSHQQANWQPKAPNFDIQGGLLPYLNFRNQAAQTNNLESTNKAIEAGILLTAAQTENMIATAKKTYQDTDFGRQKFGHELTYLQKQVEQITQNIGQDMGKYGFELEGMKQRNIGMAKDNEIKDLTKKQMEYIQKMREMGFEVSDPWYIRMLDDSRLDKMLDNLGKVGGKALKSIF